MFNSENPHRYSTAALINASLPGRDKCAAEKRCQEQVSQAKERAELLESECQVLRDTKTILDTRVGGLGHQLMVMQQGQAAAEAELAQLRAQAAAESRAQGQREKEVADLQARLQAAEDKVILVTHGSCSGKRIYSAASLDLSGYPLLSTFSSCCMKMRLGLY